MIVLLGMLPLLSVGQASWELEWLHQLAENRTAGKNQFYQVVSDANAPLTIGIPAGWLAVGLIKQDTRITQEGLRWMAAQVVNRVVTTTLKVVVNRSRPAVADPTLVALEDARKHSFPSGHTSSVFALATSISLDYPKWYIIAPAYLGASLMGYTRCYLGVHYPSDVVAGAVLGTACAWTTHQAQKWIRRSTKEKQKRNQLTYLYTVY